MPIRRKLPTGCVVVLTALLVLMARVDAQSYPTLTTLYNFTNSSDGGEPSGVVIGGGGALYGTTRGGNTGNGTVFMLAPPASPSSGWTEAVLYNFAGGSNGADPYTGVVIGSSGVLYGTTGDGKVFSLSPSTSPGGAWTQTVLGAVSGAGANGVVIGGSGVLYGTTAAGGTGDCEINYPRCGTVFSLTPPTSLGGAWTETVLYEFTGGSDGGNPFAGLVIGGDGALYGTTAAGGTGTCDPFAGCGTVFSLTPPTSLGGAWTETVLYEFTGGSDGGNPTAGLAIGSGGVLYGTTSVGGTGCRRPGGVGCGTVFSLTPPTSHGGAWTETVLHNFAGPGDGFSPNGVVIGSGGVLYDTAGGGSPGYGTVFSLTPPTSPDGTWIETVLHNFADSDGSNPYGGVVIGSAETLYGTTLQGGSFGWGTVFSLSTGLGPSAPVTVSAASGSAPVAPGSIVSIYGSGLASTGTSATMLPLPTNLGGTSVTITDSSGVQASLPLFYTGPAQINAEIPQTANTGAATLTITTPSGIQFGSVALAALAPGLFSANQTGAGVASAQFVTNQADGTQTIVDVFQCSGGAGTCAGIPLDVSAGNSALVLYGTGIRNRASLADVAIMIGSQTLPAAYAGAAPNYAGEDQVNVLMPASLTGSGTVNVSVSVAGKVSNVVTADIQ